jgi:hypothetical protein
LVFPATSTTPLTSISLPSFPLPANSTATPSNTGFWTTGYPNFPIQLTVQQYNQLFSGNAYVNITDASGVLASGTLTFNIPTITIDGVDYHPADSCELRFENIRSASIYDTQVLDIKLVNSSINMYNCRSDKRYVKSNKWPFRVDVDNRSSLVARELRYEGEVSPNIFVESISYDGSSDIYNDKSAKTSVWGPLRSVLPKIVYQTVQSTLPANVRFGSLLDGNLSIPFGAVNSAQTYGGVLGMKCAKLNIPSGVTASLNCGFTPVLEKYYFWSIHALQDSDNITGALGMHGLDVPQFGPVVLKKAQWACTYGIKKFNPVTTIPPGNIYLDIKNEGGSLGVVFLADVQIVEFDKYSDAVSFAQSRAFIIRSQSVSNLPETWPLPNSARGYFKWNDRTSAFDIESPFNIAGIQRIAVGIYDVVFQDATETLPVVQLTAETQTDRESENSVVATFENLTAAMIRVRLVKVENGLTRPIDDSFALTVF